MQYSTNNNNNNNHSFPLIIIYVDWTSNNSDRSNPLLSSTAVGSITRFCPVFIKAVPKLYKERGSQTQIGIEIGRRTDQCAENEENHEESSQSCVTVDVAVTDRRHRNESEVDAIPVGQRVRVGEIVERITRVLHLNHNKLPAFFGQSPKLCFLAITTLSVMRPVVKMFNKIFVLKRKQLQVQR